MLQQLISSKIRLKLLTLFFSNHEALFFLREIQRLTGEDVGGIKRELDNLSAIDLLLSERSGNLKYYSLNRSFPLFDELKSIISKTTGAEGALKDRLRDLPGLEIAFIYGSYARGKEKAASDIDLFLIGDLDVSKVNFVINAAEAALRREINYTIYTKKEFRQKKKSRDGFIAEVLKNKKIMLKGSEHELY